jgi:hypothetical protein
VQANLLQQNMTAVRLVMRVGFLIVNPPTDADLDADHRCPLALVTNSVDPARRSVKVAK